MYFVHCIALRVSVCGEGRKSDVLSWLSPSRFQLMCIYPSGTAFLDQSPPVALLLTYDPVLDTGMEQE